MSFFDRILNRKPKDIPKESKGNDDPKRVISKPPAGKPSIKDDNADTLLIKLSTGKAIKEASYDLSLIPIIRSLAKFNPDVSQAVFDLVSLSNTGIDIIFDQGVKEDKALEMRRYLLNSAKSWHEGCGSIHGIINKMFYQIWVAGAISNEWVPSKTYKSIARVKFMHPEKVAWVKSGGTYKAYQRLERKIGNKTDNLHRLNPYTFKYVGLSGDDDEPYGIPPMLSTLAPIKNQTNMMENINHIMDLLGLLGYLDARVEKPERYDGESEKDYVNRLNLFLEEMKDRVKQGIRDGVNVGYKDDHEFDFKSTTKSIGDIDSVWELNEQQVSSGLKYDTAFLGRSYDSSETSITILFTKMLSILSNVQKIVIENLEYGFTLALLMAGYNFKSIKVIFNKSTITDSLKFQQAEEYKIRNTRQLRMDGIIDQTQYANIVGFDKPALAEPVVPFDGGDAYEKEDSRRAAKGQRQEQEKKKRDKDNPQGTVKKQK